MPTRLEWDPAKNLINQSKHGLSFEVASHVFEDPFQLAVQDRVEGGEERWQTLGAVAGMVIVLVAHTVHDDDGVEVIRIISARKANSRERQRYEQALSKTAR